MPAAVASSTKWGIAGVAAVPPPTATYAPTAATARSATTPPMAATVR
jgi:hypothetical protein